MKFQIKNRWSCEVQAEVEIGAEFEDKSYSMQLGAAVKVAASTGADLQSADLQSANLRFANLRFADLQSADLQSADLRFANLRFADLQSADLQSANLRFADLQSADLRFANLRFADLRFAGLQFADLQSADLQSANLQSADLQSANLQSADLTPIRDDLWAVLSAAPTEVDGLRLALIEGRIDGSAYEGECACLVGTLANVRQCKYDAIPGLLPNESRPAERFFFSIHKGSTPESNQFARLAVEWIDQWLGNVREAFGSQVTSATDSA